MVARWIEGEVGSRERAPFLRSDLSISFTCGSIPRSSTSDPPSRPWRPHAFDAHRQRLCWRRLQSLASHDPFLHATGHHRLEQLAQEIALAEKLTPPVRERFNETWLAKVKVVPPHREGEAFDGHIAGLGLRVYATGVKSFYF